MELEKEISQKNFLNQHQKLVLNVLFTAGWLQSMAMRNLKPYGLSPQQYNVLRILRGQYPNSVAAHSIASRMIDRSSNVSRLVEKLRQKGLVFREENPADRRSVRVSISEAGIELLARVQPEQMGWFEGASLLSEEEALKINEALDRWRG